MRREIHFKPGYGWRYFEFDAEVTLDAKEVPDGESYTGNKTPYKSLRAMVPDLPTERVMWGRMGLATPDADGWREVRL